MIRKSLNQSDLKTTTYRLVTVGSQLAWLPDEYIQMISVEGVALALAVSLPCQCEQNM